MTPPETDFAKCKNFDDVLEFRRSEDGTNFAKEWIRAQKAGETSSEYHINLLAWTRNSPFHVLGIVLNLIDFVEEDDDATSEQIALGPVEWLVEHCPDDFAPVLRDAVRLHPGFNLYTRSKREDAGGRKWQMLSAS